MSEKPNNQQIHDLALKIAELMLYKRVCEYHREKSTEKYFVQDFMDTYEIAEFFIRERYNLPCDFIPRGYE